MLVSLENVSKSFGEKLILDTLNLTIEDNDRIGLIGANGVGKSTLLNVICGKLTPDHNHDTPGMVHKGSGTSVGFLEQNTGLIATNCIYDEMRLVFADLIETEKNLRELEKKISSLNDHNDEYNFLTEEYTKLSNYFEAKEGYKIDLKIKTVLNGMGFMDKSYQTPINTLSGGEKTRLALAKLLLEEPSLLILDEPTNHLDFKTIMWLEDYLSTYKGGLLVVSHDRYFLDKMVEKIWEVENKGVLTYKGNYTKYKELRKERIKRQLKEYEVQQNKINSMKDYVDRNIVRASTSNMAKSRLHQLEHIEVIEKPIENIKTPTFNFDFTQNPVKDVLQIEDLSLKVGIGEERVTLCDKINFEIKRGEKVALIGPNGIGKSTLLKAIQGLSEQEGKIRWGGNVKISYYEQENKTLNPDDTAMDAVWNCFPRMTPYDVRSLLGQVLITGDNVFKKVSVMSGGEKARVAFCIMMAQKGNTLILDEPTNHLDLQSKESLEKSLVEYEGTMIIVSHDRYFLNSIPTKIIEMTRDGIYIYDGNFDFYLEKSSELNKKNQEKKADNSKQESEQKNNFYRSKQDRRAEAIKKEKTKKIEQEMEELDYLIAKTEKEIALPENSSDYAALKELCDNLEEYKNKHDELFLEWAEIVE